MIWMTQTEPVSLSSLQCLALLCMETEVSCVSSVQKGQTQESVSNETVLVKSAIYYSAIVSLAINFSCVTLQFKEFKVFECHIRLFCSACFDLFSVM